MALNWMSTVQRTERPVCMSYKFGYVRLSLKFSNLSKEEWTAHQNLKTRDDIVIKPADKGGAVVVWRTDLYKQEAFRQLADT